MKSTDLIGMEKNVLLGTYTRPPFIMTHGEGPYIFDDTGKRYLDFVAGIAVNALGYGDQGSQKALSEQAKKLWHCSNLYYTEPQIRLANLLVENTFADKVFFCNSGTEAIEGAIKFARKWAKENKNEECSDIITFKNSFHGRTLGALAATGQPSFWQGFEPMLPGFQYATFNDLESVKQHVTSKTCAILLEPLQGEGGIFPADQDFLSGLMDICQQNNILLIMDEIQCGLGRTGTFCAHESYNISPDIMTLAKPIAGGLPMGAILMKDKIAQHIKPGNHGSTFGGGPLVSAVAEYIISRILEPSFLEHVREMGHYIKSKLEHISGNNPRIIGVRGKGLILGVAFSDDPKPIIDACVDSGLLVCKAGHNTIRFIPPLIVEKQHIDQAVTIFENALK